MTERIDVLVLRNGRVDFEALLSEQNIGFTPGETLGSIEVIQIVEALAPIATALATVLCSWLNQRRSREIFLELKDNECVKMEANGFSVKQVETIVNKIHCIIVSQIYDDDYRFEDDYRGFEEHLLRESGKRRSFNVYDAYERRQKSSAYFATRASDMHAGSVVVWHAYQTPVTFFEPHGEGFCVSDREAQRLGLGNGFCLDAALPPVFTLLAGLSIELQIKAIARLLDLKNKKIHKIADLSKYVGITLSSEHAALAEALSEHVIWASRYPTPPAGSEAEFDKARRILMDGGLINLDRYESLWTMYCSAYGRARKVIDEP